MGITTAYHLPHPAALFHRNRHLLDDLQTEPFQGRNMHGCILRAIGLGGQILSDLGIHRIRLLSNTPMHIPALEGFGLEIVEQVAIPVEECSRVG